MKKYGSLSFSWLQVAAPITSDNELYSLAALTFPNVHLTYVFPPVAFAELYNSGAKDVVEVPPPPIQMIVPPLVTQPAAPAIDELIQQSLWNLQQQEQHLHTLRQVEREMQTCS